MRPIHILMVLLFSVVVITVTACGGDEETPVEPTRFVPTVEDTAPVTPETEAGEEAASSTPDLPTATPTTIERRPLPPTWTSTPELLPTPTLTDEASRATPTEDQDAGVVSPPVEASTEREECAAFSVDFEQSTREFMLGTAPTIAWTAVPNTGLYRVTVFNEAEEEVHTQLVETTTYTIPFDVFRLPGPYGWNVEPLDLIGVQMCTSRGDVMFARDS
ncbi:MAG: hypothetical protein ACOCX3_01210 [Chloroflexota bacterium]